jgi:2-oxoisovalerate dehydrogenase E1 component
MTENRTEAALSPPDPPVQVGSTETKLNRQRILEKALKSRFVEEALLDLFSQGKLHGTVHTCIGQEMSGAVVTEFLRPGDTLFSNHRCHGHFISRTGDLLGLIAELMGRTTGVCGGLGGSQHLYKDGFFSNGIQGGIVPVAAGLALAHKQRGTGDISVVFIGDGTLGEGVVYEALNIASRWKLPLLLVLEDNKYSQSTEQQETLAGSVEGRARAFGIDVVRANTWDWSGLHEAAGPVIEAMRADSRPRVLHIETYRLKAHSKGDDTRSREVVAPFEAIDPLNLLLSGLSADEATWVDGLRQQVQDAVALAEQAPLAQLPASPAAQDETALNWSPVPQQEPKRMVAVLNGVFHRLMAEHESVFMLGEDILSPYGGAFKATKGLSDAFPERVRNTPISEACIVGIGTGLGLMGHHPMVEIMFGDFLGLAFDQILNHAAKFRQMYNQQVTTNVIIRTPMGGGRGYGPTHSQTLDSHFLGMPGLRIVALNNFVDPEQVYRPLIRSDAGPTLVVENKLLYGSYVGGATKPGFQLLQSGESLPVVWLRPDSAAVDITLVGYGGTAELLALACEELFERHDIVAQALIPTQIYPFTWAPYFDVMGAAGSMLIVEEGQAFAGFGAELLAQLAEADQLQSLRIRRVGPPAYCIPSSGPLEKEVLPRLHNVIDAALALGVA